MKKKEMIIGITAFAFAYISIVPGKSLTIAKKVLAPTCRAIVDVECGPTSFIPARLKSTAPFTRHTKTTVQLI